MPPRMAFDGHASDRPPRPQSDRPAIIKDQALKEFDELEPGNGSWAAAVDSDVDYSRKLVFSDEEDAPSSGSRMDSKSVLSLVFFSDLLHQSILKAPFALEINFKIRAV